MFSKEHDIDKVGLGLILGKESAKIIHKKIAPHHNIDWDNPDKNILVEKMLDYESCHYTKLGHPDTAYEYVMKTKKEYINVIKPVLRELNLWGFKSNRKLTQETYEKIIASIPDEYVISELYKSYQYLIDLEVNS
jgi:hypothetical protein